jgi:hypothetical protein
MFPLNTILAWNINIIMNKKYDNNNIIIASRAYFLQLAWSRHDWERKQAEQQRQLLDLAQARRRAEAAALPARGAPVVKLEDSSDDDLYRPTPPRFGDAG